MADLKGYLSKASCLFLCSFWAAGVACGQQMIQRGALGAPSAVLDETNQWTSPFLVASDPDVQIFMADVSSPDWLARNYSSFTNRGTYVLTFFTFYRTPKACQQNQIGWGMGDRAHLDACNLQIGYRVRRAEIDYQSRTATLKFAAMLDQNGFVDPASVQNNDAFRTWDQLDGNTRKGLDNANRMIAQQMKEYDKRRQSTR